MTLKPYFLSKAGNRWRSFTLYDIAILLYNMHKAKESQNVDWLDPIETVASISKKLNQRLLCDPSIIESMLSACNMLNEAKEWSHPEGLSFVDWVKKVAPDAKWNGEYNVLEWNDGEGND